MESELSGVVAVRDFKRYLHNDILDLSYIRTSLIPGKIVKAKDTYIEQIYEIKKCDIFVEDFREDLTVDIEKLRMFFAGQKIALCRQKQCPNMYGEHEGSPYNAILGLEIGPFVDTDDTNGRNITLMTADLPFPVDEILKLLEQKRSAIEKDKYVHAMNTREERREYFEQMKRFTPNELFCLFLNHAMNTREERRECFE